MVTMADEEPTFKRRKGKELVRLEKTINFKLYPVGFFRESLISLSDFDFNPIRIAMVEVSATGFQITARNEETNVIATLFFKSSELIDFQCTQRLFPHMIFLDQLVSFLINFHDDETIKIIHVAGSDRPQLFFKVKFDELNVDLMKVVSANPQRFPFCIPKCMAPITSTILNELIQHLRDKSQIVSVEVKKEVVIISVGEDEQSDDWERWLIYSDHFKAPRGMKYHARFYLPYLEAMRKASLLDLDPVLYFLSQPENHIMIRFRFTGFGEVIFLLKAKMLDMTPDIDPPGGDTSKASQPNGDAAEANGHAAEANGHVAEASQPNSHEAEASQPNSHAAEAPQPNGHAAEAPQPNGHAGEAP